MLKLLSPYSVIDATASHFGLLAEHLISQRNDAGIRLARDIAAYLCLEVGGFDPVQTGLAMGWRGEADMRAAHAWASVEKTSDADLAQVIGTLTTAITAAETSLRRAKIKPAAPVDVIAAAVNVTRAPTLAATISADTIRAMARLIACSVPDTDEPSNHQPKEQARG